MSTRRSESPILGQEGEAPPTQPSVGVEQKEYRQRLVWRGATVLYRHVLGCTKVCGTLVCLSLRVHVCTPNYATKQAGVW